MKESLRFLARNTLPAPNAVPLAKGSGVWFWDSNGKKYLDLSSQTLNLLLGQCHPQITERVIQQAKELTFASSRFSSEPYLKLAEKLVSMSPGGLSKVNLKMNDGSDANETAVKIARGWTNKGTIIIPSLTHVGQSAQTLRLSDYKGKRSMLMGSIESVVLTPPPYCFRCPLHQNPSKCSIECAIEMEQVLSRNKDIAGILIDPVMVNAGVLVSSRTKDYLTRIRELCDQNKVILIFDEIQTFGWIDCVFASCFYGVIPDVLTVAKGLSAGYPLAACLTKEELDILEYNEADFTSGGHPLSCAAALACLEILEEECSKIPEKADFLRRELALLQEEFPLLADVRSLGLIFGLEFTKPDNTPDPVLAGEVFDKMLEKGGFCRLYGNVLVLKPPIIISKKEIEFGLEMLGAVLETLRG